MDVYFVNPPASKSEHVPPLQRSHSINTTDYKQSITLAVGNMELLGQKA